MLDLSYLLGSNGFSQFKYFKMQPLLCRCFSLREHTDRGASYNDGVRQPVYTPHREPVKSSICSSPGPGSTPPPQYSRHLNHSQHRQHAARSSLSFSTTSRLASPSPPPLPPPPPPRRGHNEALRRNISSSFGSLSLRSAISTTGPWGNVAALSHTASVIR